MNEREPGNHQSKEAAFPASTGGQTKRQELSAHTTITT